MTIRQLVTSLLICLCAAVAFAQSPDAAAQQAGAQNAAPDTTVQQLVDRFLRIFRSIEAQGGLSDADRPIVAELLAEIEAARAQRPGNIRLAAVATQIAVMLSDDDRVFELFDELLQLAPDNEQIAQDWLTYFRQSEAPERADEVIERLLELNLQGPALRRTLANHLKQDMQYQRAIEYLRSIDLDPENNPDAIVTLAECLYAEQQFAEANEVILSIPETVLEKFPQVRNKVAQHKPNYETYVTLWPVEQELRSAEAAADDLPRAELITSKGRIEVELFENEAPNTVANFITLAEEGFYNDTSFHRVLVNFMAQGGDPLSKEGAQGTPGTGGPGYYIPDEHNRDDHRKHFSASMSMAKTALPNTAGSGFYLTFEPTPWLNGKHTVFGRVIDGMDIVRTIRQDDRLLEVNVLRKRDHEYTVEKPPLPGQTLPGAEQDNAEDDDADSTTEDDSDGDGGDEPPADGADGQLPDQP
jgi:cyclophilin family peptidyl-prolyl cis-trans isomerase/thioredoxin-like negative regulator of GroEL